MTAQTITHPEIRVRLTGIDGNVFNVIGAVSRALRRHGLPDEAAAFAKAAMDCESYDAVLRLAMRTVTVS